LGENITAKLAGKDIIRQLIIDEDITRIVSGAAIGPDQWGREVAIGNAIKLIEHFPEWKKYGRSAGYKRNELIVADCDILVAFWDGSSRGTTHDFKLCEEHHKPYIIYKWNPNRWVFEITSDWS
jgi:hypothetical protein